MADAQPKKKPVLEDVILSCKVCERPVVKLTHERMRAMQESPALKATTWRCPKCGRLVGMPGYMVRGVGNRYRGRPVRSRPPREGNSGPDH